MKLSTTILSAVLMLTFATTAFAGDAPTRFDRGKASFEAAGFTVDSHRMDQDLAKRDALRVETKTRAQDIVTRFLQAHESGEILAGGKILGLSHVVKGDIWNITVLHGDTVTVLSVTKTDDGSVVQVRRPLDNKAE
ncbi:MAG: hypothetical protein ABIK09_08465 [Pseudomonadota bacterium]